MCRVLKVLRSGYYAWKRPGASERKTEAKEVRRQTLTRSVADQRESVRLSHLCYQVGVKSFLDAQRALYATEIELARSEARGRPPI